MIVLLFSLTILSLFLLACIQWSKVKKYWANKGVPHSPPHPLMGSLTFLQKHNPAIWMRKIYDDFKSPYVGIWLLWRPALVINDPEICKRIMVKDADNFRNRYISSGKTDPIGSLNLATLKDPVWTTIRRRLTSVFTSAKLRHHNVITQAKARDLVQRIKEETSQNKDLNLRSIATDFSTDVIGESVFGLVSESTKTGDSILRGVARDFMTFNLQRGLSWTCIFFFPELVDIFRFTLFPKDSTERLRMIFHSIVQQRGGFERKIDDPTDLCDSLLKMKQDAAAEGEELSEDFLVAQAAIFLLGGFDTTGSAISFVIYELAWHPQYQQKLYEEIVKVKQKHGSKDLDSNALTEITYLFCVIKETLRIFPTIPVVDRVAAKDYKIDENLTIPAGSVVYLNIPGIQVDPAYYSDPMVFNPDRFLPENEKNITPYTLMPFGEGPRGCIGKRFAYQSMMQAISSIVLNFEIQTLPNTPKPNEIEVEKMGVFYASVDDRMVVKFVPREQVL